MGTRAQGLTVGALTIPAAELEFSYSRSSAPGGQNVNKVNSKATLHWSLRDSPSVPAPVKERFQRSFGARLTDEGVVVIQADEYRDQARNAEACLDRLGAMLLAVLHPPKPRRPTRPSAGSKRRRLDTKTAHGRKKAERGGGWHDD